MVGPFMQAADLQIICLFKHKESGDLYQGAAKETDEKLDGLLSSLRNRGEFLGINLMTAKLRRRDTTPYCSATK